MHIITRITKKLLPHLSSFLTRPLTLFYALSIKANIKQLSVRFLYVSHNIHSTTHLCYILQNGLVNLSIVFNTT